MRMKPLTDPEDPFQSYNPTSDSVDALFRADSLEDRIYYPVDSKRRI